MTAKAINIQKEPWSSQFPNMDLIYNTCIPGSYFLATKNHSFENPYPPKRKVALSVSQNLLSLLLSTSNTGERLEPTENWHTVEDWARVQPSVRCCPEQEPQKSKTAGKQSAGAPGKHSPGRVCGNAQIYLEWSFCRQKFFFTNLALWDSDSSE